jgi:hypothetical protein
VEVWIRALIIILGSVLGSGGFWKFLEVRSRRNNANNRLMMGIAYDKITTLGLQYIQRGWITKDELEEFEKYFVLPYLELGGNGIAKRIWNEVSVLPFQTHAQHEEIFRNERYVPDVPVVTGIRNHQNTAA